MQREWLSYLIDKLTISVRGMVFLKPVVSIQNWNGSNHTRGQAVQALQVGVFVVIR